LSDGAPGPGAGRPRGIFGGSAWRLGRVAGIDLAIDHSWILIFLLITFSLAGRFGVEHEGWSSAERWSAALLASPLFFLSILLHELGHSLTAMRFGISARSITLFVFGGVAQLESEPKRPGHEVVIALAGPLVSVALGIGFHGLAYLFPLSLQPWGVLKAAFGWLGTINLLLAGFNIVPGFPLDGGRVLRGIVWARTGSFERATTVAAAVGSSFAFGLIGLGIIAVFFGGQWIAGLWLAFIGWFLLTAARATVGHAVLERILVTVRAIDTMASAHDACLSGYESVEEIVAGPVLQGGLRTFFVVDRDEQLRGLITLRELTGVPAAERRLRTVQEIMVPMSELAVLGPADSGWVAFRRMAERNVNQLPVVEQGRLLGAVTREQLLALVEAQLALGLETRG
jgi:Zn-dependent protease